MEAVAADVSHFTLLTNRCRPPTVRKHVVRVCVGLRTRTLILLPDEHGERSCSQRSSIQTCHQDALDTLQITCFFALFRALVLFASIE